VVLAFRRVVEAGVEVELSAATENPVATIESRSEIFIVFSRGRPRQE
jgi:hypothetical protein